MRTCCFAWSVVRAVQCRRPRPSSSVVSLQPSRSSHGNCSGESSGGAVCTSQPPSSVPSTGAALCPRLLQLLPHTGHWAPLFPTRCLEPLLPGVVLMSPRLALGGVRVRCPHQHANLLPFPALYTKNESHLYRQLPPHFFAPLHSRSPLKEMVMLVVSLAFPPSLSESFVET